MASPNAPKTVEQLIREHSKARVLRAVPVTPEASRFFGHKQLTTAQVIDDMVRRYA